MIVLSKNTAIVIKAMDNHVLFVALYLFRKGFWSNIKKNVKQAIAVTAIAKTISKCLNVKLLVYLFEGIKKIKPFRSNEINDNVQPIFLSKNNRVPARIVTIGKKRAI